MTTWDRSELMGAVREGRVTDCEPFLATVSYDDANAVELRAELAVRGYAPLSDVVQAATADGDYAGRFRLALEAVFPKILADVIEQADPVVTETDAQVAADLSAGLQLVHRPRELSDPELERLACHADVCLALRARRVLARRRLAQLDFAAVTRWLGDDWVQATRGVATASSLTRAAVAAAWTGQLSVARALLSAAQAAPGTSDLTLDGEALEDSEPPAVRSFGALGGELPWGELAASGDFARLRAALQERDRVAIRVELSPELLEAVAEEGASVLVDDRDDRRSHFRVLQAACPALGMAVLGAPDGSEARLVPITRILEGDVAGRGALVVCGAGDAGEARRARLRPRGVEQSPALVATDAALFDYEHGASIPFDLATQRLRAAITAHPDSPAPVLALGRLLVGGQLTDSEQARSFLDWYVLARERFPALRAPGRLYTTYVRYCHPMEAAVALAPTVQQFPRVPQLLVGLGIGLYRLGRAGDAIRQLREGLRLDGLDPAGCSWLAALHRDRKEFRAAEVAARFAMALDAGARDDIRPLLIDALEGQGRHADAEHHLEEATKKDPQSGRRLAHRLYERGEFERAGEVLRTQVTPDAASIDDLVQSQLARGDGEGAFATVLEYPAALREVIDTVLEACLLSATDEQVTARLTAMAERHAGDPTAVSDLAYGLACRRLSELIPPLVETVARAGDETLLLWTQARVRLGAEDEPAARAEAVPELLKLAELTSGWPVPARLAAALLAASDPAQAAELAGHPSTQGDLAAVVARSLIAELADEGEAAEAFRRRLAATPPAALADAASFYLRYRCFDAAAHALSVAAEHASVDQARIRLLRMTRASDALEAAIEAERRNQSVPFPTLVVLALRRERWDLIHRYADEACAWAAADSRRMLDTWHYRALSAAATLRLEGTSIPDPVRDVVRTHDRARFALASVLTAGAEPGHRDAIPEGRALSAPAIRMLEEDWT